MNDNFKVEIKQTVQKIKERKHGKISRGRLTS